MHTQLELVKTRLLSETLEFARSSLGDLPPTLAETFVRHYYQSVPEEDLAEYQAADLGQSALGHLRFGNVRQRGESMLRIFNPTRSKCGWESMHTVVEMVNNDMPFLVDSLGMAINKHGLSIHLTIHPVLRVRRDPEGRLVEMMETNGAAGADNGDGDGLLESFMHFEIDQVTAPELIQQLETDIVEAMRDVRASVEDWRYMRIKARNICNELEFNPPPLDSELVAECLAFIKWMEDENFTFLGYREYKYGSGAGGGKEKDVLYRAQRSGLGILRDRDDNKHKSTLALWRDGQPQGQFEDLLILSKASLQATVHRPGDLDYVAVKDYDANGKIVGEKRFLGLFTSAAYSRTPQQIPLLRHKVEKVLALSEMNPASHGGKALTHILNTFPRDELFQSTAQELLEICTGILHLQERQRVKLFIRREAFGRFFSCLVFIPRDRYNTRIREQVQSILMVALRGKRVKSSVVMTESVLARVHFTIHTTPWDFPQEQVSIIEQKIAAMVRSWEDNLSDALTDNFGEGEGLRHFRRFSKAFPAAYREDVTPQNAALDIAQMAALEPGPGNLRLILYRPPPFLKNKLNLKIIRREQVIPIFEVLPMLENMGLQVLSERPYKLKFRDGSVIRVQDFEMECGQLDAFETKDVDEIFEDAFVQTWLGRMENDGFNQLVLRSRLTSRQTTLLRAYCKYLLQTGIPFSQVYMEKALESNHEVARLLVQLFEGRFNPKLSKKQRQGKETALSKIFEEYLRNVRSLDEDRILRSFFDVIKATLRTNYFQTGEKDAYKSRLSIKMDPRKIPNLPEPRPMFEIFVYSPRFEGIHLRGGRIARGGLRWSDRREDFRTEVLGLMKAQVVKNTVIVPNGAKGGFVAKQLPSTGDRNEVIAEVVHCYRGFISGLLDLTDNINDQGQGIVKPKQTVCLDQDDPYLVVAADKGTATFSDIANEISHQYGFWLGDAFASGGSVGYDHKVMGITARGAWESVKRHFREMGRDPQKEDITVVGIGDMAGDVFGNGLLQSRHLKLQAAFNHMHIFLDPNPDPEKSYLERERLFRLPRSTWADYNQELISKGGGVFSRDEKEIHLNKTLQKMLGLGRKEASLAPNALIRVILKMEADLLWNGGIGTYCKASTESNAEVGDHANDSLRVNGCELRCNVVGEGGNLGFTQLGRVEYALKGGRINADFIDNAGGVDCSDREVNIKILLNKALRQGTLGEEERNKLLHEMTDEVASLVVLANYRQTQAISMMESTAADRLSEHAFLIRALERDGFLNRELEFLPSDTTIAERKKAGLGLTRPELSVLLSYAKITIYNDLIESSVPEDPYLAQELEQYFPRPLHKPYQDLMESHTLRREIIVMLATNSMAHRMGPTFANRMQEETGADIARIARAYTIAREVFDARSLWKEIEGLDNAIEASLQYGMMFDISRNLKHVTRWLLQSPGRCENIQEAVSAYKPGMDVLMGKLSELLARPEKYLSSAQGLQQNGVSENIARRIAGLEFMYPILDITEVAAGGAADLKWLAACYFEAGAQAQLSWLRSQIENLKVEGHWQAVARGTLRENIYQLQRDLLVRITTRNGGGKRSPTQAVARWLQNHRECFEHALKNLEDMKASGPLDFATLSVALQVIRKLL